MGADVIKVEVPGMGDLAWQLGADPELKQEVGGPIWQISMPSAGGVHYIRSGHARMGANFPLNV